MVTNFLYYRQCFVVFSFKPLAEETITVEEALLDFKQKLAALEQAEQELEDLLIKEGFEI
mgnify:CR=1 FL=1